MVTTAHPHGAARARSTAPGREEAARGPCSGIYNDPVPTTPEQYLID
ncbi:hypothetical protein F4561_005366 [Lipingzhangella halophila]|uniref:Uncharacterized protein n=1 Tax=Lipingzhangella halophila TaxID=1783352 RepID=A0A7W7W592_9ACTN|nr:hypothetical protein [Lipingzhangella halophila]MBB4934546.1 hypothetical protein [Lipingzhangella halophila]